MIEIIDNHKNFIQVDELCTIVRAAHIYYATYKFSRLMHLRINNIDDTQIQWNIATIKRKYPIESGEYLAIERVPVSEKSNIYCLSVKVYISSNDKKKSGWRNISKNPLYINGLDSPIHYLEKCNEEILAWTKNIFPISPTVENKKESKYE